MKINMIQVEIFLIQSWKTLSIKDIVLIVI